MKSFYLLCFFIGLLAFAGCKQKPDSQKAESTGKTQEKSENAESKGSEDGHDYTFLTHKMLIYRASSTLGKDPKDQPYAGQWIDFDPDGTFKAGKLSQQTHTGKWKYNHDSGILFIQPDDTKFKTSEWKVQYNDDMVIFVGTATYGDNATQIQLYRSDKFPE